MILTVDDDPHVAAAHAQLLTELGYEARAESDPLLVERHLRSIPDIDMVLLDIRMPQLSGMELLRRIKFQRPGTGVIMATVINDIDQAVRAIKIGAYNYLLKPLQRERLAAVVSSYFSNRPPNPRRDPRFSSIITASPLFDEIFQRAASFSAAADVTVLIEGETGTGKELIAQLLHTLGDAPDAPFIAVNVAALSPQLFESELFGHRKGAFTGACINKAGYCEEGRHGTLFFDEIGELGADLQKKLLRLFQTRKFTRVGETQERDLCARLVVATNRQLLREVEQGNFREDLYYRLMNHAIRLPPLRERRGDIELLANYFLGKYRSQYGRTVDGFDGESLACLRRYDFPGNVRELEGMVSAAVLLEQDTLIRPRTLPEHVRLPGCRGAIENMDLESIRYRSIMRVLAECDGNQTRAAAKLGIARGTLNRFLRQFRERACENL